MRTRSSARFFLLTLVFVGCDLLGPGYLEIREVTVGPTLAKCYGVGLQSCMVVDGEFFYGRIGWIRIRGRLRLSPPDRQVHSLGWDGTAAGCRPVRLPSAGATGEDPRHRPPPQPCRWVRRG